MKKLNALFIMLTLGCGAAFAQDGASAKLKEVQQGNMWVPAGIKIDGRLDEWVGFMHAFNTATKVYYAIANDDKNLYLVMLSTDALNNTKLMTGGITLAINTDGKKKTENAYNITYPVLKGQATGQRGGRPMGGADALAAALHGADTATINARNQTLALSKEIRIAGFKDIADSLISVYNEQGMKVSANFDSDGNYTYEIAIPLSLIGISPVNAKEFAYNIKINGPSFPAGGPGGGFQRGAGTADANAGAGFGGGGAGGGRGGRGGRGGGGGGGAPGGGGPGGPAGGAAFQEMTSPTDFWGKYTLAKK